MSDISAMGLGLMGSALARSLVKADHRVSVWNRSSAKAYPLVELGAVQASSVTEAVMASPILIVCVDTYSTTRGMFEAGDVIRELPGKVIVQLSTGSPREARENEAWFTSLGAKYLDGAILAGPDAIGTPRATILYSGGQGIFEYCTPLLKALAGDTRFVGENAGSAAALDLAWLSKLYGTFVGAAHGAIICEAEGLNLSTYSSLFADDDNARWLIDVINSNSFVNPGATLSVWNAAVRRISDQAQNAAISCEVPSFVGSILDRAEAAGLGAEHIAAMVKVLRHGPEKMP